MHRMVAVLVVAIVVVCLIAAITYRPSSPPAVSDTVTTLRVPGVSASQQVPFAVDEAAFRRMVKAGLHSDTEQYADELLAGSAFLVTNGTKVRVIDSGVGMRKLRALEGANLGRAGWVPAEWVR